MFELDWMTFSGQFYKLLFTSESLFTKKATSFILKNTSYLEEQLRLF